MRKAKVFVHGKESGILEEVLRGESYSFTYHDSYEGEPVSLTMPVTPKPFVFDEFPPFFDGLLPEGGQLESLLRNYKVDRRDLFSQLMIVGEDVVGCVTVKESKGA